MRVISKRLVAVAIATFLCVAVVVFALHRTTGVAAGWGQIFSRDETVRGQVTSFIIDDRGAVNGFVLSSGDQGHFSPTLGEALIAANINTGADVSAQGHAGTRTDFGREVRAREISFNGRTFVDNAPAPPRRPHNRRPPREPRDGQQPPAPPANTPPASDSDAAAPATSPSAPPAPRAAELAPGASLVENVTASGAVSTYLVGGRGEVTGVILASGEQFRIPPHVRDEILSVNNNAFPKNAQVSVTGDAVRTERGTSIRARTLSIGDRTYALGR